MTLELTPVDRTFVQNLWYAWFRSMGWNANYHRPEARKYIIIVYPHTSNLDFFIGFIFSRAYALPAPRFMAKQSAFRGILGPLMRKLGGVPVDRSKSMNFVDQIAEEFARHDDFIIAITPEGTRSKKPYWKSGFYYIALAAKVPIVMATIDFPKRLITYGNSFMPTGDIDEDLAVIRANYAGALGRHPERMGEIRFRETEEEVAQPAVRGS